VAAHEGLDPGERDVMWRAHREAAFIDGHRQRLRLLPR
jgi:hypothetical protein